jgi:hypothetical protein
VLLLYLTVILSSLFLYLLADLPLFHPISSLPISRSIIPALLAGSKTLQIVMRVTMKRQCHHRCLETVRRVGRVNGKQPQKGMKISVMEIQSIAELAKAHPPQF